MTDTEIILSPIIAAKNVFQMLRVPREGYGLRFAEKISKGKTSRMYANNADMKIFFKNCYPATELWQVGVYEILVTNSSYRPCKIFICDPDFRNYKIQSSTTLNLKDDRLLPNIWS